MSDGGAACHEAAQQLALCMESTPCVRAGRTIMECIRAKEVGDCEVRCWSWRLWWWGRWGVECQTRACRCRYRADGARRHELVSHLPPPPVPVPQKYRLGYYHCRRQQLDMRTRIRGRKFADAGTGE